jgi:chromosome segregation ATPase
MCASEACRRLLAILVLLTLLPGAWAADAKKDAAKEQLRRMQQLQRKLEQEKTQLSQDKAAAEGRLKEVEGRLGDARQRAAAAGRQVEALTRDLETLGAEKSALAGRLAETEQRLGAMAGRFEAAEQERQRLEALAGSQQKSLADCSGRNDKLAQQGRQLLEAYQRKSCMDATLQRDPVFGLKRIEVENFVEDEAEKLEAQRFEGTARR